MLTKLLLYLHIWATGRKPVYFYLLKDSFKPLIGCLDANELFEKTDEVVGKGFALATVICFFSVSYEYVYTSV